MRKLVSLISVIIFSAGIANAYTFTTYTPPVSEQPVSSSAYVAYPKITKLEEILLNSTYETEDISTRLSRLEKKVLKKTYPTADFSWRVENLMSNADTSALYGIDAKELASIEKQVLGRSYKKECVENRLTRVEQELFGASQSGKPDERFETVRTAAINYTNFASANPSSGINAPRRTSLKSKIQNVFTDFIGAGSYMTGYTPPIMPYGDSRPYGFSSAFNPAYQNYFSPYRGYNSGWNSAYSSPRHSYSGFNRMPCGCTNSFSNSRPHFRPNSGFHPHSYPNGYNSPQSGYRIYNHSNTMGAGSSIRILD